MRRPGSLRATWLRDEATTETPLGCIARLPTLFRTSASNPFRKEVIRLSKARLIYFAVFAILIATALLPALQFWPDGPHEGGEI